MPSYWLCDDCLFGVAYDDYTALSLQDEGDAREAHLRAALQALMPLSADFDPEHGWGIQPFSRQPCDCCGSPRHGQRHCFTRL